MVKSYFIDLFVGTHLAVKSDKTFVMLPNRVVIYFLLQRKCMANLYQPMIDTFDRKSLSAFSNTIYNTVKNES